MNSGIKDTVAFALADYVPSDPEPVAIQLRQLWLQFEPKSMGGIKAEQRELQETTGIPVPVLRVIGAE